MVRAPDPHYGKTALKKVAWSPEEDQKLIAYINRYGIWNWSKMPKPAGLVRSGKSCRLRWVNYLKPGVKHGNFSKEERETVLKLHELLGNRWSAIAAKLPGRTDNEIKNYWHTNLKKCVRDDPAQRTKSEAQKANQKKFSESNPFVPNVLEASKLKGSRDILLSPQLSTDDFSSSSTDPNVSINEIETVDQNFGSIEIFGELPSFLAEPFSFENLDTVEDLPAFADPVGYISSTSQSWIQAQTSPFGSLETVGDLQRSWAENLISVQNASLVEDRATFEDSGYISSTYQKCMQEQMNIPFGSLETYGEFQSSCPWAEPFSVENSYLVEDQATFGSDNDTGIDFWFRLFLQAEMGDI